MKITPEQIEAFRREHHIAAHLGETPAAGLEPWAVEQNFVLNAVCDMALLLMGNKMLCPLCNPADVYSRPENTRAEAAPVQGMNWNWPWHPGIMCCCPECGISRVRGRADAKEKL